jgi:hypothetical protein
MIESLRAAWQTITWRKMLVLQALGQLAIYLDSREEPPFGSWMGHPSEGYLSMALIVFLLVPIALLSDEAVKRGAAPKLAYPAALISTIPAAGLATTVTQHIYLSVFGLPPGIANLFWRPSVKASFHMYIYGAFGMLVFMNQRIADRMLENFRNSELRRAQLERQLVESRLATAEAQIDPTMLFEQLAEIKLGFRSGGDQAEVQLTELIQTLRAALARTVSAHESVANPSSP